MAGADTSPALAEAAEGDVAAFGASPPRAGPSPRCSRITSHSPSVRCSVSICRRSLTVVLWASGHATAPFGNSSSIHRHRCSSRIRCRSLSTSLPPSPSCRNTSPLRSFDIRHRRFPPRPSLGLCHLATGRTWHASRYIVASRAMQAGVAWKSIFSIGLSVGGDHPRRRAPSNLECRDRAGTTTPSDVVLGRTSDPRYPRSPHCWAHGVFAI